MYVIYIYLYMYIYIYIINFPLPFPALLRSTTIDARIVNTQSPEHSAVLEPTLPLKKKKRSKCANAFG